MGVGSLHVSLVVNTFGWARPVAANTWALAFAKKVFELDRSEAKGLHMATYLIYIYIVFHVIYLPHTSSNTPKPSSTASFPFGAPKSGGSALRSNHRGAGRRVCRVADQGGGGVGGGIDEETRNEQICTGLLLEFYGTSFYCMERAVADCGCHFYFYFCLRTCMMCSPHLEVEGVDNTLYIQGCPC